MLIMKSKDRELIKNAASMLGKKSAEARKKMWGEREFNRRLREWGKLGGRPKKIKKDDVTGGDV
jgi:hypothetical protein